MSDTTWDLRFLNLAQYVSTWSKDPSTKMGAVVVDPKRRIVGVGYNGFPRGIEDSHERLTERKVKYALTVHCEMNAILNSNKSVEGCTLYTWPFGSCERCAIHVIQVGIKRCVSPVIPPELMDRWMERLSIAWGLLRESGVEVTIL